MKRRELKSEFLRRELGRLEDGRLQAMYWCAMEPEGSDARAMYPRIYCNLGVRMDTVRSQLVFAVMVEHAAKE